MKRFMVLMLGVTMLFSCFGLAEALQPYLDAFIARYPNAGAISNCGVCHNSAQNPGSRNSYGAAYGSNGHNFTAIEPLDSDGDGFTNLAEITNVPPTYPGDAASHPAVTCTSFIYSAFSECQPDNTQTRTVISASPAGCTGGNPVLTQSCTYVPPATTCTSFTYSAFSECQPDNTQTRTVVSASPAGCTGGNPVLTQSCTYVPPANTCTSFTYSAFSECQPGNTQTRTVVSASPAGCTGGNPVLTQSCTYVPPPAGSTTVTVNAATGTGPLTIETLTGGTNLTNVSAISSSDASLNQSGKPSGFAFNDGLLRFTLNGVAIGGVAQVRITYPADITSGSKVYKIRADGFHEYTNASISGKTVTLTLTDGGDGDSDGAANGSIADPVGVASPVAVVVEDGGGGCSIGPKQTGATALADSVLILMPLIVIAALRGIRRRNK
ncbi:MAG: hypothetical protein HZB33_15990 [Nitrospirae bacterium]|nr:hypothetical protein [Nitrospirota bacterium]